MIDEEKYMRNFASLRAYIFLHHKLTLFTSPNITNNQYKQRSNQNELQFFQHTTSLRPYIFNFPRD